MQANDSENDRMGTVDRMVVHGEPLEFRDLCRAVLTEKTRYLVLDLDRTFHLGRNMGELFGWELGAFKSYGPLYHEHKSYTGRDGRCLVFDWSQPLKMLHYIWRGAVQWAYPGLFYLLFLKMAWKHSFSRKRMFLRFGPRAVEHVQKVPLTALMHQSAGIPMTDLKTVVRHLWSRLAGDQVIFPQDIAWLREGYPGIKIIVSSASPQPLLEVVREQFGVDDVIFTEVEECHGLLSAPTDISPLYMQKKPLRISPPSMFRHNASAAKLARLLELHPDMADPLVESVGITDTSYGEDHAWANLFTRVADINSSSPFPPLKLVSSPLREIHSAMVLTQNEKARRLGGETGYMDPRRKAVAPRRGRAFERAELEQLLEPIVRRVELLRELYPKKLETMAPLLSEYERFRANLSDAMERAVTSYNESIGKLRRQSMRWIRTNLKAEHALDRRLARMMRPLSAIEAETLNLLEASRALIDVQLATG
jgi:hypothetical protein